MIQLTIFGKLIPFIMSGLNMPISLYIFEKQAVSVPSSIWATFSASPHIPGTSLDSVLGCGSKCPAHRGGVLNLSPFLKPVFEEILLLLTVTLRTFTGITLVFVSSRLA